VSAAGAGRRSLPLRIDVAPIVPAPTAGVLMGVYCYYLPQHTPEQLRDVFADMRAHGMTTAFVFNANLRIPIQTSGGRALIQWDQPNQLREVMELYGEAGFGEPLMLLAPEAFHDAAMRVAGEDNGYGPGFTAAYSDLFAQLKREAAARGWPPFIVAPYDEGYPYPFADLRFTLSRALIPPLRLTGLPVAVHSLNHPAGKAWRFEREFQPLIDVFLHTFAHPPGCGPAEYRGYASWEQYRDAMDAAGRQVLFYNPDCTGVHPEALRFVYGVGLWKLRARGMITWHYFESQRDGGYGLGRRQGQAVLNLVYPPTADRPGGPTIGWEAIREGVQDYRLLAAWDHAVREGLQSEDPEVKARAVGARQAVDAIISRIRFQTIDPVGALALPDRWEGQSVDEHQQPWIHGEYKLDNGLSLADYDELRRRLCQVIAELRLTRDGGAAPAR
jgi:hypothetical protein